MSFTCSESAPYDHDPDAAGNQTAPITRIDPRSVLVNKARPANGLLLVCEAEGCPHDACHNREQDSGWIRLCDGCAAEHDAEMMFDRDDDRHPDRHIRRP